MLAGANTTLDDAELHEILRNDLGYLRCADAYILETTPSIRFIDRCAWTSDGCQEEWHPYSFAANLGSNDEDNPAYNDVL